MTRGAGRKRPWTEADLALLRARYPHESTEVVAAALGRTPRAVGAYAHVLGLAKTPAYKASMTAGIGVAHRFQPGHTPWIKGKRGVAPSTAFKVGNRPANKAEVGETRFRSRYVQVKVADQGERAAQWRPLHHLVWEEVNGPIPPGHALAFRDGNRRNTTLENLELVARADWINHLVIHRLPPEMRPLLYLKGALTRAINRQRKKQSTNED